MRGGAGTASFRRGASAAARRCGGQGGPEAPGGWGSGQFPPLRPAAGLRADTLGVVSDRLWVCRLEPCVLADRCLFVPRGLPAEIALSRDFPFPHAAGVCAPYLTWDSSAFSPDVSIPRGSIEPQSSPPPAPPPSYPGPGSPEERASDLARVGGSEGCAQGSFPGSCVATARSRRSGGLCSLSPEVRKSPQAGLASEAFLSVLAEVSLELRFQGS